MALNLNQWYRVHFPSYGVYKIMVMVEEDDEMPEDVCEFELTSIKDGHYYKARLDDPQTPCSYALTNVAMFCETGPNAASGMANLVQDEFSTTAFSEDIMIVETDQWVVSDGTDYFLHLFYAMGNAPLEPCDNGAGEAPDGILTPPTPLDQNTPAVYFFPVPPGGGGDEKKMRKKKIRVIWKKDI
ncbi:MAG: hypothetical protein RRA94_01050 [Bacteroidota bacterium]|nr:hypothetical protein [Bacteroidota bacterium]